MKRPELPVPPAAAQDPKSREIARVWIAGGKLQCVVNIGTWSNAPSVDERHAWGIVLADIARHVSDALEQEAGHDRRGTLIMVRDAFNAEIDHPTSSHTGAFAGPDRQQQQKKTPS